jgi:hypothetical protein
MVIFTYRPEYYAINEYSIGNQIISSAGLMVLIVAKHRAGQIGELRLGFNGQFTRVENYIDHYSGGYGSANANVITPNWSKVEPKQYYNFEEEDKLLDKKDDDEPPF